MGFALIRTVIGAVVLLTAHPTLALQALELTEGQDRYQLGPHLEYLEDGDGRLTIDDLADDGLEERFYACQETIPNFGLTHSAYWFRFRIANTTASSDTWILELSWPITDMVDLYLPTPQGGHTVERAGDLRPFRSRTLPYPNHAFAIALRRGEAKTIHMRVVSNDAFLVPLFLWSQPAYADKHATEQFIYGAYFGVFIVMIVYHLLIFLSLRDRSYLYFVLILIFMFLHQLNLHGYSAQYLWPGASWWADRSLHFFGLMVGIWLAMFSRNFLMLRDYAPRVNMLHYLTMAVLGILMPLLVLFVDIALYNMLVTWVGIVGIFIVLAGCAIALRKGYRPARIFFVALAPFMFGGISYALKNADFIPHNLLTASIFQIGIVLTLILFSLGLSSRINLLKEEKERAQRQAEHDQLKSRFFANVSHELRSPLTLILTPLERLLSGEQEDLSPAVLEKLRAMAGNTHRLLRLVNQLLDFSRLESGAESVSFEPWDIRALVEPLVQGFVPFARSKGLTLELKGPDRLPKTYVDPGKLDKIVSNLLSNACKFTNPGGGVVVRLSSDSRSVKIAVKDSGIGIPEQDLPRIFERFRQVDSGAARRYEGTGIGLALSRELVELMAGELGVESETGVGSTFTVTLLLGKEHILDPAAIRDASHEIDGMAHARAAATALAAEVGTGQTPRPTETGGMEHDERHEGRPLVLVVEDNVDMRALVGEICRKEFNVLEAPDGKQGLDLIVQRRPALVISDIMMPEMDGHELLQRIRSDPATASIPVILLTAKAGPEMMLNGLERGADDYLTKPFESRELLARARNLVRLQQQERQLREINASLQQEVMRQAGALNRARTLQRYLPPDLARAILDGDRSLPTGMERRRLTVFLLELRLFEDRVEPVVDPEDMPTMLNSYLSEMVEVAFTHGATVDTFIRDRVVGYFGAPESNGPDQDAQSCASMAIEMWQRAVEVCERWRDVLGDQPPVPTMVLSSGLATVGNFGSSRRLEYTAMGGPVEEVRSLLARVSTGELVCTNATWLLIQDVQQADMVGEVTLPNRPKPIKLFRLAGPAVGLVEQPEPSVTRSLPGVDAITGGAGAPRGLEVGVVLSNRYEILDQLGEGGMSSVYLARDLKLGIEVAMKFLQFELADFGQRKQLYREVRLARLISHPNVARIYDLGEWHRHEYITMEYIQGESLEQKLRSCGALSLEDGRRILLSLCDGLAAAHAANIVHSDLKPGNIMLRPDGRVAILDFGIARQIASAQPSLTESGQVIGTPLYMAPEQARGEWVDHRTDIYSLGVVAFEMFTGNPPFVADSAIRLAHMHTSALPPNPLDLRPDLPPRLAAVILRCLEKSPKNRFASVTEIVI